MAAPHVLFAGRTTLDALYRLDQLPDEDTKVFAREFRAAPGGPACNAAITHALLGGRATLLTAVGKGPWADVVRAELQGHSIRVIDLADGTDYETPLTVVLVNEKRATRTIVNPPLSEMALRDAGRAWDPQWGDAPTVVLSDGFYLGETLPLLSGLRDGGAALCLDGGSWKPGTDALAPLLTAAICSERFALPEAAADAEATLAWFAGQGVLHVAVTRGPRSILCLDRGRRFEVEIASVEAVDTLGAGDVLHGAFCHGFAGSGDFEGSLRRAAEVATRSCEGLGIGCWGGSESSRQP